MFSGIKKNKKALRPLNKKRIGRIASKAGGLSKVRMQFKY